MGFLLSLLSVYISAIYNSQPLVYPLCLIVVNELMDSSFKSSNGVFVS
jgi:hypothetical protein